MIVKRVQNALNQNILLIVHDDKGNADTIIANLYKFLEDQVIYHQSNTIPDSDLVDRYFLSEMIGPDPEVEELDE